MREGIAVTNVVANDDAVAVELDDGTSLTAQWVIAADGHYSPVRRMTDGDGSRASTSELGTWHAFRQYFRGVDDGRMWVLFDPELLPGYAWVFPVGGGRANVGFGVLRDTRSGGATGKQLAAQWREVVNGSKLRDILGPRAEADGAHRAWPIPASFDAARLAHGRVLFAGDAANVVDPMTGEGIAQALDTGILAAHAIEGHATPQGVIPGTAATSNAGSVRTCGSPARSNSCCAHRWERAPPSAPRTSRRGRAATSLAGCSRTTRARPCSRRGAGIVACSPALARTRTGESLHSRHGRRRALAAHAALVHRHPARLPASAARRPRRARVRRAARPRAGSPRVRVSRARVHGLEERRRHQLRTHRHRRRRARLPRLLEGGRPASRQGRPLHVERGAVPHARRRGRVGRCRLRTRAGDQARASGLRRRAAPDPPRRQQPLQPRRRGLGRAVVDSSSPTSPTASWS